MQFTVARMEVYVIPSMVIYVKKPRKGSELW